MESTKEGDNKGNEKIMRKCKKMFCRNIINYYINSRYMSVVKGRYQHD